MRRNFGIKGFLQTSFTDWPGRLCSVVFLAGCGFRCPACHNAQLVLAPESLADYPIDEVLRYLESKRSWVDGVTVTGGEPTGRKDLPDLLRVFRRLGVKVKLDTNGSNPAVLEALIAAGLVDAVFMDVKAPLTVQEYSKVAGVLVDVRSVQRSIELLKRSGLEVTFRTTIVPGLVEEPQLESIVRALGDVRRYVIQAFRGLETLDPALSQVAEFSEGRVELMRRRFEISAVNEFQSLRYRVSGAY
jgi:pyruvate formate lyase activating enzyme